MSLNPLKHSIVFSPPRRLTPYSAWHQHIPSAMFLVDLLKPRVVVELGAYYGDSYCAFCQAIQELGLAARCYAVDTWEGDPHGGFYGPEVLASLREHHDPVYSSFSSLVKTTFDDALRYFSDGIIDLLHIDGYHTYEAVKHDFESWLPKMSVRGVVLFHDINVRERNFGVWKLWEETTEKHPYFEFVHGHGLGVLAVGKDFPTAFQEFLEASLEAAANIRRFFFQLGQRLTFEVQQGNLSQEAAQLRLTLQAQQQALAEKEEHAKRIAEDRDRLARDLTELQSALNFQQQGLADKEEHANRLVREIDELRSALNLHEQASAEKRCQFDQLSVEQERLGRDVLRLQARVRDQQEELANKDLQIIDLTSQQDRSNDQLGAMRIRVQEKEAELAEFGLDQDRLYRDVSILQAIVQHQRIAIEMVYGSLGWLVTNRFRPVKDRFLLPGSRLRQLYDNMLTALKGRLRNRNLTPPNEIYPIQFGSLIGKESENKPAFGQPTKQNGTIDRRRAFGAVKSAPRIGAMDGMQSSRASSVEQNVTKRVVIKEEAVVKQEAVTVSVVIPTKNGGEDFRRVLAAIANQKGFRQIEILVVDSGSTDKTVELAGQFGAKVIKILPEEFTHSYARNLGARHASGQYLLFTVQDALPPSDSWLYELFSVIKNNEIAAVSCAEFPAASADLFYRAISWNHYRFLEVDNVDKLMSKNGADDHISLRKNGQLSDLACLISWDVFTRYEYRTDYGEDLDLGLRLIQDGHSLAFLGSTRIIHSHNRPAYYYLKRAYVENLFVPKILPDYPVLSRDFNPIVRDVVLAYQALFSLVAQGPWALQLPCKVVDFSSRLVSKFEDALRARSLIHRPAVDDSFSDPAFVDFLKRIINEDYSDKTDFDSAEGILGEGVMNFIRVVLEYMEQTYEFVDGDIAEDFRSSLSKAFAYQCGAQFAGCFLKYRGTGHSRLEQIHAELSKGV